MSLVGTLGKVAMGVLVAKGLGKAMGGGGMGRSGMGGGGLGGLLGGVLGGAGGASGGARRIPGSGSGGGLGDLGALLGGRSGGAGGAAAGGLGGLLESISGGGTPGAGQAPAAGSLGGLLNGALQGESVPEPAAAHEAQAKILIQAMINAAKSDGSIDQSEQQKIVSHLGDDVSEEERRFVISEMQAPLDLQGFVASVPSGAEQQVYMMSVMGIELDHPEEAKYLDQLRKGLNMDEQVCDAIHRQLGVGTLYS